MASWAQRQDPHGWVILSQLWDKLEEQDPRLYSLFGLSESLCEVFDLRTRGAMHRPRSHLNEAILFQCLSTADAAALVILLNELGFLVDPAPLVEVISPVVQQSALLTEPQRYALFFHKLRGRGHITLATRGRLPGGGVHQWRTAGGLAIEFLQDGDAAKLSVKGARYRARLRSERACDVCGQNFCHGDLDSLLAHREYHQRFQRSHSPKLLPRLVQRANEVANPEVVDRDAPHWLHSEVYERAYWFHREMGYDRVQWDLGSEEEPPVEQGVGCVFTTEHEPGRIVGACAFREREDGGIPAAWTMDWAWIAPAWRRSGTLSRYWPLLVRRFGDFPLEYPLSPGMKAFVLKHGTPIQRETVQKQLRLLNQDA